MTPFILYVWRGDARFSEVHRFTARRLDLVVAAACFAQDNGCSTKIIRQGDL